MSEYDSMNVHELVSRLIGGEGWFFKEDHIPLIESALRKAVIREASAGTIRFDTCCEDGIAEITGGDHDGVYDLIPKETP